MSVLLLEDIPKISPSKFEEKTGGYLKCKHNFLSPELCEHLIHNWGALSDSGPRFYEYSTIAHVRIITEAIDERLAKAFRAAFEKFEVDNSATVKRFQFSKSRELSDTASSSPFGFHYDGGNNNENTTTHRGIVYLSRDARPTPVHVPASATERSLCDPVPRPLSSETLRVIKLLPESTKNALPEDIKNRLEHGNDCNDSDSEDDTISLKKMKQDVRGYFSCNAEQGSLVHGDLRHVCHADVRAADRFILMFNYFNWKAPDDSDLQHVVNALTRS